MKIRINHLVKDYPQQRALSDISFEIEEKEIVCVLGPSGSGKSTLLRCLCGLEKFNSGQILFDGKEVDEIHPAEHKIAVVFDEPKLIDHFTVFENIALGLEYLGWNQDKVNDEVCKIAAQVELEQYLQRKPKALSAGQKQRVALARALVRGCNLLLLDEALSNLDGLMRKKLIQLIQSLHLQRQFSCLMITHNLSDAKLMNTKTILLDEGKVLAMGDWTSLKENPPCEKVAAFLEE